MEFKRSPRPLQSPIRPVVEKTSNTPAAPKAPVASRTFSIIGAYIQSHQSALIIGAAAAVIVTLLVGAALQRQPATPTDGELTNQTSASKDLHQKTLTPAGTSIDDRGGWSRISPPGKAPVFAYSDSINGTTINVSQQAIPESFKTNIPENVAELAKSYNATATIDANGTTVHIGDSAKGPQSVIFTKSNLLIMIKSQQKIPAEAWVRYINSLK